MARYTDVEREIAWSRLRNLLGPLELGWLFVPRLKQGTYHFTCLVLRRHFKPSVPCTGISDINAVCTLKNVTGYSKRAGDYPATVDCTSKIQLSTLGPEEKYSLSVRSAIYSDIMGAPHQITKHFV